MVLAEHMRERLKQRMEEILQHFLVAMVEEYPAPLAAGVENPWEYQVLSAGVEVFTFIMTGAWLYLPVGLAVRLSRHYVEYNLYGPEILIKHDLAPILEECHELKNIGVFNGDHEDFYELMKDSWMGDALSPEMLHTVLSEQSDLLQKTGSSYVKSESYRRHKKMLKLFKEGISMEAE
jgi:hypothetical protein